MGRGKWNGKGGGEPRERDDREGRRRRREMKGQVNEKGIMEMTPAVTLVYGGRYGLVGLHFSFYFVLLHVQYCTVLGDDVPHGAYTSVGLLF